MNPFTYVFFSFGSEKEAVQTEFWDLESCWYTGFSTWKWLVLCVWPQSSLSIAKAPTLPCGALIPTAGGRFSLGEGFTVGWSLFWFSIPSATLPQVSSLHLWTKLKYWSQNTCPCRWLESSYVILSHCVFPCLWKRSVGRLGADMSVHRWLLLHVCRGQMSSQCHGHLLSATFKACSCQVCDLLRLGVGSCLGAPVCAKSLQSYPTLCDPMNCSPPGSSVHEISQARILE